MNSHTDSFPVMTHRCGLLSPAFRWVAAAIVLAGAVMIETIGQTVPNAATQPATLISSTSATLNGMAVPNGLPTFAWFEWGPRGSYSQQTSAVELGSGTTVVRLGTPITGLVSEGVYQCRLVASNAAGISPGFVQLFTSGRRLVSWLKDGQFSTFASAPGDAVSLAEGYQIGLALTSDNGTVVSWNKNGLNDPLITNTVTVLSNAVGVTAGGSHRMAVLANGQVVAWGNNYRGQTAVPVGLNDAVLVRAGDQHSLALKRDGTVLAWGLNSSGQCNVPPGLSNVVDLAGGSAHTLALRADGTVVAWGNNNLGQSMVPSGLSNVVAVGAGSGFSIALKSDGSLAGWPANAPIPIASNVVAISAWNDGVLALSANGTVRGSGGQSNAPAGLSNIVAVAADYFGGAALGLNLPPTVRPQTNSGVANEPVVMTLRGSDPNGDALQVRIASLPLAGTLYQFSDGVPGSPITSANSPVTDDQGRVILVPVPNTYGEPYTSFEYFVSDGEFDSPTALVIVSVVGRPYAATQSAVFSGSRNAMITGMAVPNRFPAVAWFEWGEAGNFDRITVPQDIGAGSAVVRCTAPVSNLVPGVVYQCRLVVSNRVTVALGAPRWFGFRGAGKVLVWGSSLYSQTLLPLDLTNVVEIAIGGGWHSLALKSDRTVVAWGRNNYGQVNLPAGLADVVGIGAGDNHSLALKADGTVVAWGWNAYGETNVPPGLANVVAVAGGGDQSLALKADGTVVAWGANNYGEATVPAGLSNVVAVAGGFHHSIALKADGTVVGWGRNYEGQAASPPTLTNAVAIASAGGDFNLALRADRTVFAWGNNDRAQCNVPAGLTDVMAIGVGASFSFAVRADGALAAWGEDLNLFQTPFPSISNVVAAAGGSGHAVFRSDFNLPPEGMRTTASGYANHDMLVQLKAFDPNGDNLSYRVASLPTAGTLYQSLGNYRGAQITSPATPVDSPFGQLIYAPPPNAFGAPYATFGYIASDAEFDSPATNATAYVYVPPAPQLTSSGLFWDPVTGFQINFSGTPSATYRVWASSNLVSWEPLGAAAATSNGWFQFLDFDSTNWPNRFYKAGAP